MNSLWLWVERPVPQDRLLRFLAACVLVHLLLAIGAAALLVQLGLKMHRAGSGTHPINLAIIPLLIVVAFNEECFFRFAPLAFATTIGNRSVIVVAAVLSSAIFGWLHGDWMNLFVQGVGGLFYCIVFLKCSSFGKDLRRGLCCSTAAHAAFDLLIVALASLAGESVL